MPFSDQAPAFVIISEELWVSAVVHNLDLFIRHTVDLPHEPLVSFRNGHNLVRNSATEPLQPAQEIGQERRAAETLVFQILDILLMYQGCTQLEA